MTWSERWYAVHVALRQVFSCRCVVYSVSETEFQVTLYHPELSLCLYLDCLYQEADDVWFMPGYGMHKDLATLLRASDLDDVLKISLED